MTNESYTIFKEKDKYKIGISSSLYNILFNEVKQEITEEVLNKRSLLKPLLKSKSLLNEDITRLFKQGSISDKELKTSDLVYFSLDLEGFLESCKYVDSINKESKRFNTEEHNKFFKEKRDEKHERESQGMVPAYLNPQNSEEIRDIFL